MAQWVQASSSWRAGSPGRRPGRAVLAHAGVHQQHERGGDEVQELAEGQVGQAQQAGQDVDVPHHPVEADGVQGRRQGGEYPGDGIGYEGARRPGVAGGAGVLVKLGPLVQERLVVGLLQVGEDHPEVLGPERLERLFLVLAAQPAELLDHLLIAAGREYLVGLQAEARKHDERQEPDGQPVGTAAGLAHGPFPPPADHGHHQAGHHQQAPQVAAANQGFRVEA